MVKGLKQEKDDPMIRILLKSVYDAFDYVMNHYYPAGQREFAKLTDTYAVISIQDTHTDGFGFEFVENKFCKGVLTLYFDDIFKEVDNAILFSEDDAEEIIDFVLAHRNVDTLLVHCYGGESRSRAVAAFIVSMFGKDNSLYFITGRPNEVVYKTLVEAWNKRKNSHR